MNDTGPYRFADFALDVANRRLMRGGAVIDVSGRYFDALALLVREAGQLVSKDAFMGEVWRSVPVTDEALTQCIRTLRRQLGDDAAAPRFIETVPKHGYRFIAPVHASIDSRRPSSSHPLLSAAAGTVGGGAAGAIGGLLYGFGAASQPLQPGMGAASVLLVLLSVTILIAAVGASGVSLGIALADRLTGRPSAWRIAGGAIGGLMVGGVVKLLGLDAFALLFGQSPGDITGAVEGLALGAAVGIGAWASKGLGLRRAAATAGAIGGAAGVAIVLSGGRLMGGSLALLGQQFPQSRLRFDRIGGLFGEDGFGPVAQAVSGGVEGALFGACIVGAMLLARRHLAEA